MATSVGGSATGKGGDRIIVDDLHNPHQADSDAQREAALRFFRETLSTRLDTPKTGAVVVVMQRLHEADLSARCLELGYRHLCLPVEADVATDIVFPVSGRVVTREPGYLLWPAREGQTELAIQRRQLGSTAFDTQYQQRPAPAGGRLFKRAWFKFYDEPPRVSTWLASWDMSFKGGPSNDYVVGLQAAREGADVYLVDRVKGQWDFHGDASASRPPPRPVSGDADHPDRRGGEWARDYQWSSLARSPASSQSGPMAGSTRVPRRALPIVEAGNVWLPHPQPHGRARSRARVGERLPAPALRVFRRARTTTTWMPSRNSSRAASSRSRTGWSGQPDDFSTQVPCVMTHASYARPLTARTKTANGNGLRHDCGCGRPPRRSGLQRGPAVRPPETVVAMALADHAFKAGRQPGDDGVTI